MPCLEVGTAMPFELTPAYIVLLPLLGATVAALGTLVGLGGGFILVPILIVLFPEASPATIASISLTVVFLNATSATIGNVQARRIDGRTALILVVGAIPAAAAGSLVAGMVSRERFELAFGVMLLFGAAYVLWRSSRALPPDQAAGRPPNRWVRERKGPTYSFYVSTLMATVISPVAGFISSFFGIGGGVLHVPSMTFILKIPSRVASATSLLVLVPTSFVGVLTHVLAGQYHHGWRRAGLLGLGALVGAQVGVYLSPRVNQKLVLLILAAALAAVGVRQIMDGLV